MLYNQHNLAVAKIAAKENGREALTGVYFTRDKTAATDGFRLLEISTPAGARSRVEQLPEAMRGFRPFLARAKEIKTLKVRGDELIAIKHVHEHRIEFLQGKDIKNIERVAGEFPQYEGIFPTTKPEAEVVINGDYLAEIAEIMAKLDPMAKVRIKIYGKNKPVVLEAGAPDQKGRGMIMPMVD